MCMWSKRCWIKKLATHTGKFIKFIILLQVHTWGLPADEWQVCIPLHTFMVLLTNLSVGLAHDYRVVHVAHWLAIWVGFERKLQRNRGVPQALTLKSISTITQNLLRHTLQPLNNSKDRTLVRSLRGMLLFAKAYLVAIERQWILGQSTCKSNMVAAMLTDSRVLLPLLRSFEWRP